VSEDGRDVDVTLFPSWLEGTTSKPVEKSWNGLFCSCFPVRTLLAGRYWKEGRNGREEDLGVRVEGFQMGQTWFELRVGSCQGLVRLCSTLRGLGKGDDDGKGIRVVDEVNESVANVAVDGDCNVWRKMVAAQ